MERERDRFRRLFAAHSRVCGYHFSFHTTLTLNALFFALVMEWEKGDNWQLLNGMQLENWSALLELLLESNEHEIARFILEIFCVWLFRVCQNPLVKPTFMRSMSWAHLVDGSMVSNCCCKWRKCVKIKEKLGKTCSVDTWWFAQRSKKSYWWHILSTLRLMDHWTTLTESWKWADLFAAKKKTWT